MVSKDDAHLILEPHLGRFQQVILGGFAVWTRFTELMPDAYAALGHRTQPTFVNEQVVHLARSAFAVPGVRQFEEPGFLCLDFAGRILVHFKKLDKRGLPSSYPTEQQQRIAMQELPFPECPGATWVTAGYHFTSPVPSAIDGINLVCAYADHVFWAIPIYDAQAGGEPALLPFAPSPISPPPRVTVRAQNVEKPEGQ